jgi:SecD/SecF fusion protein
VIYRQFPDFARTFGILPFKIDLNVVAAVLTILGYSLNDTIIVMDRIRENRGKLPYASRKVINDAINQTISRTIITAGTTFLATMVLYIVGGEGVRVFAYTMLIGILVGTYSSIAVAAPLLWVKAVDPHGDAPSAGETGSLPERAAA